MGTGRDRQREAERGQHTFKEDLCTCTRTPAHVHACVCTRARDDIKRIAGVGKGNEETA